MQGLQIQEQEVRPENLVPMDSESFWEVFSILQRRFATKYHVFGEKKLWNRQNFNLAEKNHEYR